MDRNLQSAWWPLRLAFFLGPFLAGLDKFFYLLTNWDQYLSPLAARVLGGFSHPFMLVVGVIEMCVGLMIITKWTRIGAYIATVWLILIALNLVLTGHYLDIALRDIGLALSAFGLARLTEAMQQRAEVRGFEGSRVAA
jgi:type IV secretory pathway VirB2 component (pilin)